MTMLDYTALIVRLGGTRATLKGGASVLNPLSVLSQGEYEAMVVRIGDLKKTEEFEACKLVPTRFGQPFFFEGELAIDCVIRAIAETIKIEA